MTTRPARHAGWTSSAPGPGAENRSQPDPQRGHNIGGNTSPSIRRAVYFRIKRSGHDARWREFLSDPWLDYDTVRERHEGDGNGGE
jgi:hypothetical protein